MSTNKEVLLKKYKFLATALFVLMLITYALMLYLQDAYPAPWQGYVKAFSEAGMVGALADWFAVTALFKYPLGIKIPHTNLIESNKDDIGANLGNFVTDNFLTPANIRPYVEKLDASSIAISWLDKPKNQALLSNEIQHLCYTLLKSIKEEDAVNFIQKKLVDIMAELNLNDSLSQGFIHLIKTQEHNKLIDKVFPYLKAYIVTSEDMIEERIKQRNALGFVFSGKLSRGIVEGLLDFVVEIEKNQNHSIRKTIEQKLLDLAAEIKEDPIWQEKIKKIQNSLFDAETNRDFVYKMWNKAKNKFLEQLGAPNPNFQAYLIKSIGKLKDDFNEDAVLKEKLNSWVQQFAYKLVLQNTKKASQLIQTTVSKWDGKSLSSKLELEVGKDLQFIRINGTLVGGCVGLLIFVITTLIKS